MLSTRIARVGKLNEVAFAKSAVQLQKIKEMDLSQVDQKQYLQQGLSMIFTKASNLIGLKDPISNINKLDIVEMIMSRFKALSLEEIDYAFKLDRYSGEPVQHFQLFNAEYVGKILYRYREWLRSTRANNNLPMARKEEPKEMSPEEKEILVINGAIECFEIFLQTGEIALGKTYVYDYLYEKKLLPYHSPAFKEQVKRKAIKQLCNRERSGEDRKQWKFQLREIQAGKDPLKVECKNLVLIQYFSRLKAEKKHLQEII